jgi:DNA-binding response OmpR family regulator
MATNSTLLCIHRDPTQLSLLRESGYDLITASNGREGLQLFMSRSVDAIVLEYHLGLLDGSVVATEIKQVKPQVPIVMLTEDLELPDGALESVDAVVTKTDGPHFLLEAVHLVLNVKPSQPREGKLRAQPTARLHRTGKSREWAERAQGYSLHLASPTDAPFSPSEWRSIRNGVVHF